MDFWTHQSEARRKTLRLLALYGLGLFLLSFILAVPVAVLWGLFFPDNFNFYANLALAVPCIAAATGVCCFFAPVSLKTGGRSVAEALDCAPLDQETKAPRERRLLNIVEEMALASGLPAPPVYIMEDDGINAFAAGSSPQEAVIGVTRGALDNLSRDELQGVIAHEFSHIQNGDMRLNLRFAQILFGLICVAGLGGVLWRLSRNSLRKGTRNDLGKAGAVLLLALGCFLFGLLGKLLGRVMQAAVNRQREFLADASAVQFTRTTALASALKRIGSLPGRRRRSREVSELYNHFFFCRLSDGLLSTHPPLEERIRRVDPAWDGVFNSAPLETDAEILQELSQTKAKAVKHN